MTTPQPETLMLAMRDRAAAAVIQLVADTEELYRDLLAHSGSLEHKLRDASELNSALQERLVQQKRAADNLCHELRSRIAELELDVMSLRDRADTLNAELRKRETAIVDLILRGTN